MHGEFLATGLAFQILNLFMFPMAAISYQGMEMLFCD